MEVHEMHPVVVNTVIAYYATCLLCLAVELNLRSKCSWIFHLP